MREEPKLEIRPTPIFVPKPPVEDEVNDGNGGIG